MKKQQDDSLHRCLSIPEKWFSTRRYGAIVLKNGDGETIVANGIEAIVIQHEIDHMDGKNIYLQE